MKLLLTNLEQIISDAIEATNKASDLHAIDQIKSKYIGKNGKITESLRQLSAVDKSDRPKIGQEINRAKDRIINILNERYKTLEAVAIEKSLHKETIDVTLPPRGQNLGTFHPITKIQKIIESFFINMGFSIVEDPEIENEFYNFTALNIPLHHPARAMHDTFYFSDGTMLRSQTSPVQIRAMQKMKPPLRIICPGRVFRCDNDATHTPMFHQMEMLIVDEKVNFANLKWLINKFLEYFFNEKVECRFRPSYFPFTAISAEVDAKWYVGNSCKWLELGGCGVVHPNVLQAGGIDNKKFCGLAFGFGIERLAMVYYGINDLRMLFENDLQFLQQF